MWRGIVGAVAVVALAGALLAQQQGDPPARDAAGNSNNNAQFDKEIHQALSKLDRRDVAARVNLARLAIQHQAWDTAREVLDQAQAIEPNNPEVLDLVAQVNQHAPPPNPNPPPQPEHQPATKPAVEHGLPKRQVTNDEINHIRQLEWQPGQPVRVQVDADARRKFLAKSDMKPQEFNRLPLDRQAAMILHDGGPDARAGVRILTDPPTVGEFHNTVQKVILSGCAAANCHGAKAAGNFMLFSPANNANATYSNFLLVQQYSKTIGKTPRLLVDRQYPEQSLLLQYMLPPTPNDPAEPGHPPVVGYKGLVPTKSQVRYEQVLKWLKALDPRQPDYGIDLTKDAPKKEGVVHAP
jgi:hypothetical protein